MKKLTPFLIFILIVIRLSSQAPVLPQKDTLEWFNFWVGDWDIHWFEQDSFKAMGENIITNDLNNAVITENFKALTGQNKGYLGRSVSIFDRRTQKWRQTWVDSTHDYLEFEGGKDGDTFYFERRFMARSGKPVIQKMVFYDITPKSFMWDWKASQDEGKTWKTNWQIFYTRKQPREK